VSIVQLADFAQVCSKITATVAGLEPRAIAVPSSVSLNIDVTPESDVIGQMVFSRTKTAEGGKITTTLVKRSSTMWKPLELEGFGEEIVAHSAELAGRRCVDLSP